MKLEKLIFDIGMHKGQDSQFYLKRGYKVIAVEANPILAKKNADKFKAYIDTGQLIIENVGMADKKGVLPFYINKSLSEWSSFNKEYGSRRGKFEVVNIECITINDLIEKYGIPYYIKVDIEGYDYYIVNNLPGNKVPYVSCEFTDIELLDELKEKGYNKFKMISQGDNFRPFDLKKHGTKWFPKYLHYKNGIRMRAQEFISFAAHPYSSSGPFGEDTKGDWHSYDEIRQSFFDFNNGNNGKPLHRHDWFDLHASNG